MFLSATFAHLFHIDAINKCYGHIIIILLLLWLVMMSGSADLFAVQAPVDLLWWGVQSCMTCIFCISLNHV